ncbi:winged helix-turn-helix transcriptional regulator [Altererythrobacter sp. Root672]|uniref:winged helix-turn-helix transcriptional regulator n=1 Tax=Altererythrobacter sp. Root672 TaxID=1736584 RepID=UPI0006FBB196|nr:helix-turn-helix domain-containing protein [Altererythrobacter sp. Root672]KRA83845.1 transcriptional regulator [Altererythrobacter sp. Root672]
MKLQKETESHGKWYQDACGTAFAMELVGERWSILIVRELMLGGRRFSDLRASLPGISAKVLTERLTGLEEAGVLMRRKLPPPAATQVYELTEWGYLAEPAIQELGRWAARSREHNPQLPLSPVSLMLSMRTMLVPEATAGVEAKVGFDIAGETFLAHLRDGQLPVRRGEMDGADAVIRASAPLPVLRVIYGNQTLEAIEAEGGLRVEGDREAARRFCSVFSLPDKVD